MTSTLSAHRAYREYLSLDTLLDLQKPNTGQPDELLFIVVHQSHELWFKELLHELGGLQSALSAADSGHALRTLRRLRAGFTVLVAQIGALETLTAGQFAAFRERLGSSGFYSAQFREIELVLGRCDGDVARQFPEGSRARARIEDRASRPRLFASFLEYLAACGYPPDDVRSALRMLQRDDTVAAQVCEGLRDLDQAFQEWRFRHAVLARRVIGDRAGTGGSTGAEFLRSTVFTPSFPELWFVPDPE